MNAKLHHIQLNITNKSVSYPFYKEMLSILGYTVFMEEGWGFGMKEPDSELVIWVAETEQKYKHLNYHRKAPGVNHLAFNVATKEEVDKFYDEFLSKKDIKPLYSTPKAFPEYSPNYYALFFEDPDRIKIEIVSL